MIGEYNCPFLYYSGKVCDKSCMRPEGCRDHWNAIVRLPCTDCGKPTHSGFGRCPLHIGSYYISRYH